MVAVTFDTYKFVRKLKGAGFDEKQAEALTEAVRESHESAELATKGDIENVCREISDLRKDMDARFVGVHAELSSMKWVLGMVAAGMVALLVKSFF